MYVLDLIKNAYQGYADNLVEKIPAISAAAVVLALFVLVAGLVRWLTRKGHARRRTQLFGRISQVTLITIGVVLALGILGINFTGLVAGLGLLSVGLSFAMQDLLVNFLAGIQLLSQSSFERGDHVTIGEAKGTIRFIGGRAVKLVTKEGDFIYVPNRDFLLKSVTVRKSPAEQKSANKSA